jgi:hypothetical protein
VYQPRHTPCAHDPAQYIIISAKAAINKIGGVDYCGIGKRKKELR